MLTVILVGGKSSRMGRDKAVLPLSGTTFASTLIKKYETSLGAVAVGVDRAGRFDLGGALELVDAFPGKGPMNGLYSAFTQTDAKSVFLTATDLPYGDPELVKRLESSLGGYDACIIRRSGGYVEPLFAVYSRSCFEKVKRLLESDRRALSALIEDINVNFLDETDLPGWDLEKILMNVNTPDDYERVLRSPPAPGN